MKFEILNKSQRKQVPECPEGGIAIGAVTPEGEVVAATVTVPCVVLDYVWLEKSRRGKSRKLLRQLWQQTQKELLAEGVREISGGFLGSYPNEKASNSLIDKAAEFEIEAKEEVGCRFWTIDLTQTRKGSS